MKATLVLCILLSISAIECRLEKKHNRVSSAKLASSIESTSKSLKELVQNQRTSKTINTKSISPIARSNVENAVEKVNAAYNKWKSIYNNKTKFETSLAKMSALILERAYIPEYTAPIEKSLESLDDPQIHTTQCEMFIKTLDNLLAMLIECAKHGEYPLKYLQEIQQGGNARSQKARAAYVGLFDMIHDNSVAIASALVQEHEMCVQRCDKMNDMITLMGQHDTPESSSVEE